MRTKKVLSLKYSQRQALRVCVFTKPRYDIKCWMWLQNNAFNSSYAFSFSGLQQCSSMTREARHASIDRARALPARAHRQGWST